LHCLISNPFDLENCIILRYFNQVNLDLSLANLQLKRNHFFASLCQLNDFTDKHLTFLYSKSLLVFLILDFKLNEGGTNKLLICLVRV
jgi:hypothetical protein